MKPLETLQTDKATFSIGQAISDGWSLISKYLLYYILGGIIAVAMGFATGIVPFIGSIANSIIITPCLMAGAIYVTWRISNNIAWTDIGDMFKGFKFASPIVISSLIQTGLFVLLFLLAFASYLPQMLDLFKLTRGSGSYTNQEEIKNIFLQMYSLKTLFIFLLLFIALLFISIIWVFKLHFIVIYQLQAWAAMEMSRKISINNFLPIIGLYILLGLIILVSLIPCGLGLFFSLPLSIGSVYSAFAQITHCNQPDEINTDMFDFIPNKPDANNPTI